MGDSHEPGSVLPVPLGDPSSSPDHNPTIEIDPLVELRDQRRAPLRPDERQALVGLERTLFGAASSRASLSRYVLEERIGSGGAGVVFRAHDPHLERKVAVKLVLPRSSPEESSSMGSVRLLREAKALAKLSHPNVVAVYDVGTYEEPEGSPGVFMVMELVEGPTLAVWLREERPFPDIVHHLLAAGRGLAAAHAAGLVHRDFKPHNAIVGRDGRVRVVDFGLARQVSTAGDPGSADSRAELDVTGHGVIAGTPRYMAPEQHDGEVGDERSDQFALCLCFYEAVFGQRAYDGDTLEALVEAKKAGRIRTPPAKDVPRTLFPVLARGLAPDPQDRHPDLDTLLDELARESERVERATTVEENRDLSAFSLHLHEILSIVLGRHTAGRALALACRRAGKAYGTLDEADGEIVTRTLGPMLRTLAGRRVAVDILAQIANTSSEGTE